MQYRRLTAHLQTGSADFNRRLSAYLTNHVAMRTALDHAITNSYAQQYPNAPQFAHNQSVYPSPIMTHNLPQNQSSQSYGQPYPKPGTPGYRSGHHASPSSDVHSRKPSMNYPPSLPTPISASATPHISHRRTSASSKASSHSPPALSATPKSIHSKQSPPSPSTPQHAKGIQTITGPPVAPQQYSQSQNINESSNPSPFTTSLPMESQMLLGSALDPNDPMTAMLMSGSENMPQPFAYSSYPTFHKPRSFTQPYDGMSATLAPSALDMSPRHQAYSQPGYSTSMAPAPTPAFQQAFAGAMPEFPKTQLHTGGASSNDSGSITPSGIDGGWDTFINDNSWGESIT